MLIPAMAGSIVLAYNLPGVENIKLSREAYVDIFLGKITKWNDPTITKTNDGVQLPNLAITVCERSDGSGTSFVFTKHLSAISPEFKDKVGEGTSVTWPIGIAGKGNDGVTSLHTILSDDHLFHRKTMPCTQIKVTISPSELLTPFMRRLTTRSAPGASEWSMWR